MMRIAEAEGGERRHGWRRVALLLGTMILASAVSVSATEVCDIVEKETDAFGMSADMDPQALQDLIDEGMRVVNLDDEGAFCALWVPRDYGKVAPARVLVLLHGSDGSAYAEIQDELDYAMDYCYALVAVQWWDPAEDVYLNALQTYAVIDLALRYLQATYGADPSRSALVAFSRGSAQSFEITYWDRLLGNEYFVLTIAHSGGIPTICPHLFVQRLLAGELGREPFSGTRFFLYCGMEDEEWGTQQCLQMHHAEEIVIAYGGTIVEFVEDLHGAHLGYRLSPGHQLRAIQTFLGLTL